MNNYQQAPLTVIIPISPIAKTIGFFSVLLELNVHSFNSLLGNPKTMFSPKRKVSFTTSVMNLMRS